VKNKKVVICFHCAPFPRHCLNDAGNLRAAKRHAMTK
jgi:hypothetical protein